MSEVDLSRYRSPVTLGTKGAIVLDGDGVAERHIELHVERGPAGERRYVLLPLAPGVTVERHGIKANPTSGWRVQDGDIIRVGTRRVTFRDLCTAPERNAEGRQVPWLQR